MAFTNCRWFWENKMTIELVVQIYAYFLRRESAKYRQVPVMMVTDQVLLVKTCIL